MTDVDRRTVDEFRANGGQAGGVLAGTPLVLIHHVGARSGIEHVTPLAYLVHQGGIAIAASNGGSPHHPAWYHNLKAHPAITVELGTERFQATAEEQAGPARAELWTALVARFPDLARHAAGTERTIPLFLLRRAPQPKDQLHGHPERTVPSALPRHCSPSRRTSSSGARRGPLVASSGRVTDDGRMEPPPGSPTSGCCMTRCSSPDR